MPGQDVLVIQKNLLKISGEGGLLKVDALSERGANVLQDLLPACFPCRQAAVRPPVHGRAEICCLDASSCIHRGCIVLSLSKLTS